VVVVVVVLQLYNVLVTSQYMPNRKPGSLLLNMLIKNEANHLSRSLPKWAKIIDAWIIGVDDNNTDNSREVIQRYLGHIPGQMVTVHFEGMGPTWSQLVEIGLQEYPNITHGILSDADFMPIKNTLNKMELDVRCSKHMYTIWPQDLRNERKMDWIYRNIPGAVVKRRTHQILEVPPLPNQEVFQTLIDLPVQEHEGGYQDRTGVKNQRYIEFLEKDLLEYPNDTRTLYYLGYAHFDIFSQNKDKPRPEDWKHLEEGVKFFKLRADTVGGNQEELWFALLKLGEIYERFYRDWPKAEYYYTNCSKQDPERADAWFYLGQHHRLRGDSDKALPYLYKAASIPIPTRSLFQWHYLYLCLSKLEYGRAVLASKSVDRTIYKKAKKILAMANCNDGDPGNLGELKTMIEVIQLKLATEKKVGSTRAEALKKLLNFISKKIDKLEDSLTEKITEENKKFVTFNLLLKYISSIQELYDNYKSLDTNEKKKRVVIVS